MKYDLGLRVQATNRTVETMAETTLNAAAEMLRELNETEFAHWIPVRGGTFLASYVAWLCRLAADKSATNEDERAYYWLQHWRWLTADDEQAKDILDRTIGRLRPASGPVAGGGE